MKFISNLLKSLPKEFRARFVVFLVGTCLVTGSGYLFGKYFTEGIYVYFTGLNSSMTALSLVLCCTGLKMIYESLR